MDKNKHAHAEPLEPLLSVAAVCAILDAGRSALYGFMASGALPYVKLGDRRLIEPAELRRFVAERRVQLNDDGPLARGPSVRSLPGDDGVAGRDRA